MSGLMVFSTRRCKLIGTMAACLLVLVVAGCSLRPRSPWTEDEIDSIRSLWIGSLAELAADPSNAYGDNPAAAALGHKLFFDTRFSSNGKVACGTCHLPDRLFQDDKPLATGIGTTNRRTMTIIGTAYSPWLFWDGRKDSQWAQALGPMENPVEHGGNRTQYAHLISKYYRKEYEALFGPLPDLSGLPANAGPVQDEQARAAWEAMSQPQREAVTRIYANMGKAIAAYERLLLPGPARFDRYAEAVLQGDDRSARQILTAQEAAGLRLFIGKANCTECHNGALFTDNHFHNTGIPAAEGLPEDNGRERGAKQVQVDEFNCLSEYSDAPLEACSELRYMISEGDELIRQFKPPSLRNVTERAPYMHAGQVATLQDVLMHYNTAPASPAGHSELKALNLNTDEIAQLIAFLHTLSGPLTASPEWLAPPAVLPGAQ
jgi:cytochrome c peroxidase